MRTKNKIIINSSIKNYVIGFMLLVSVCIMTTSSVQCLSQQEIELQNALAFARLCRRNLSSEAFRYLLYHDPTMEADRTAMRFLASQGMTAVDAQFIVVYFLAQNLPYPGELITLSTPSPDFHTFFFVGSFVYPGAVEEVNALWARNLQTMITQPEVSTLVYDSDLDAIDSEALRDFELSTEHSEDSSSAEMDMDLSQPDSVSTHGSSPMGSPQADSRSGFGSPQGGFSLPDSASGYEAGSSTMGSPQADSRSGFGSPQGGFSQPDSASGYEAGSSTMDLSQPDSLPDSQPD
ncbi:MAG: hypothetical protein ACKO5C_07295 [Ferruginibacter sp.]